jgi:hypothetical protein
MLAQNFKSAAMLRISEARHASLLAVLRMLERPDIPSPLFDMRSVGRPECGTPGCIMGHARALAPTEWGFFSVLFNRGLRRLFFPLGAKDPARNPYNANREHAAIALRSYLTTGEANWTEARYKLNTL